MKPGIAISWDGPRIQIQLDQIQLAEKLGFDSVWSAEAYGSDALTPLAYIAGHTRRIRLATGITQVAARAPTATAMAMATIDQLAGDGRVICGLGLSGPQVVEGWYGQAWPKPSAYLRDYVDIMRQVFRRKGPVQLQGEAIQLPFEGAGSSHMGKPLKPIIHPNPDIPIWLGTGSQKMVTLTAEIADGWLPFGFVPGSLATYRDWLQAGFDKAGNGKGFDNFEIQAGCQIKLTRDVKAEIDRQKFTVALYVGGMGHEKKNFHKDLMVRRGYEEAASRIQQLFLQNKREQAVAAVPDEYIDDSALIGDAQRIRGKLAQWAGSGATGLTLHGADAEAMRVVADYFNAA